MVNRKGKVISGVIVSTILAGSMIVNLQSSAYASTGASSNFPKANYPKDSAKVTLTVWNWNNNFQKQINVFEKMYPNIHVNLENVGSGQTEYQKLQTAISTGTGAPDLAMIEYAYLPQFIQTGGIANISSYDSQYSKYFPSWVWNQVSYNGGLYAIPSDVGPMGLYYQPAVLAKNHLSVPTTWAQFQQEAEEFHKANPGKYFSFFSDNDGEWMLSLLWQAGVYPFHESNGTWKISFNTPQAEKVMQYWGNLVKNGSVQLTQDFSPAFMKSLGEGDYATVPGSVWFSGTIQLSVKPGAHNWQAGFLPNWKAGQTVDSDWGGSSNAVMAQSKHPKEAALLAAFLSTNAKTVTLATTPIANGGSSSFSSNKYASDLPVMSMPLGVLNNQEAYKNVFAKGSLEVDPNFEFPPFGTYVYNQMSVEFVKAFAGHESWSQALGNLQQSVTQFARSQGYKVSN